MKQVFECGIACESNDEVGDAFLAGIMGITLPPTKNRRLPDDFTLELKEHDLIGIGSIAAMEGLWAAYGKLRQGLMERGYTCYQWYDQSRWCHCFRFKRRSVAS